MPLEERRAVIHLAVDDKPRLLLGFVGLELVEGYRALDLAIGHANLLFWLRLYLGAVVSGNALSPKSI